ncbi:PKD domain-containing protein [Mucilaginibacter sp. Bleaf8]|uniref:PKD domain-containing protein n=1 Tax=Mucilaginibacter sp. Bleaf8 TaxID=2834430 RepID=UPI001BCAED34|nr:PKD domain-containing protein [Mucilaginibacter sp. Bleaf8]MBS7565772.1 PKD domain-containing protein [Mucilaginibacter sp. Bleaf8]
MKHLYLFLVTILLFNVACNKLDSNDAAVIPQSDFKFSSGNNAYLTQVIEVIPTEAKSKSLDWTCDFGNGVKVSGNTITSIPYSYVKEGNYKVSLTVAGNTTTQNITVLPGLRSYQIHSKLSQDLFVSTEVAGNRKDIHVFRTIKANTLTDTAYSISTNDGSVKMIIYGVFTGKNNVSYSYRTSSLVPPLEQYKHTVIELKDDEPLYVNYTLNGKDIELYMPISELFKL